MKLLLIGCDIIVDDKCVLCLYVLVFYENDCFIYWDESRFGSYIIKDDDEFISL